MTSIWMLLTLILGVGALAALSRKWCIGLSMSALLIGAATAGGVAAGWFLAGRAWQPWLIALFVLGTQLAVYVLVIAYRFYRDPERQSPADPAAITSPADGEVIYIRRIRAGEMLRCDKKGAQLVVDELQRTSLGSQEVWQIGISMVFTDVHVNRAPMAGKVALVSHQPGQFLSLRVPEAVNLNERQTMVFDNGRFQIAIVQIASRLVRRIVAYVGADESVGLGQRVGMIKFGSQVDVILPVPSVPSLQVTVGQRLVAGESILGRAT